MKFYASMRLEIRKAAAIKSGEEILGSRTKVKVVKNKLAPPFKNVEFDLMYGEGISRTGDLLDMGVELDIVNKSGSWYSFDKERIGQGRENVKAFLLDNPDIFDAIELKVRTELGIAGPEAAKPRLHPILERILSRKPNLMLNRTSCLGAKLPRCKAQKKLQPEHTHVCEDCNFFCNAAGGRLSAQTLRIPESLSRSQ